MCQRMKLWGLLLCAAGLGLFVSGFVSNGGLRFVIGIILIVFGVFLLNRK